MRNPLRRDSSHGRAHRCHLEVVLDVSVCADGAVATDDAADQLHVDVTTFALCQVGGRRHLKP